MNLNDIPTKELYKVAFVGDLGAFAIEIRVGGTNLPNLDSKSIRFAGYEAEALIRKALMVEVIKNDVKTMERARQEKQDILALFPQPIFVEEIPNGYSPDCYSTQHLPWFVVTTKVGRFTIGWRRRVIEIDWSETRGTKTSAELFASEDVTKEKRLIHADSYEKAKQYIAAIIDSAN